MILKRILLGWNLIRGLRLLIGAYFAVQAIETLEIFSGIIAAFFLYQAITNTGCCGANACAVPNAKNNAEKLKEVDLIEVESDELKIK
jgi:hypothetical protein